jgi:hypothetical protein
VQLTPLARPQPGRDLHATSVRMPVPFATAASGAADGCLLGGTKQALLFSPAKLTAHKYQTTKFSFNLHLDLRLLRYKTLERD